MPDARTGIAELEADLARQREAIAVRCPPYERALALLPSVLAGPPGRFLAAAWKGRRFNVWWDRPLLLLASLRDDALLEGPSHPLWQGLAAPEPRPEAVTVEALRTVLDGSREGVFQALARRAVQTNETSRAVAWLWPAALAGASGGGRTVALADIGASAGLNLVADALPGIWTDADGTPLETAASVHAVARLGLDPAPLDALSEDGARWLRACVWPGEGAREARLDAALAAFRAARTRLDAPVLLPIAAANVPARLDLLSAADPAALVIAYQTVMRDYLEPGERKEYETGMRDWLGTQPPRHAVWVELEPESDGADLMGSIVAHVRAPGGELRDLELGRCELHPSRIERRHGSEAELRALLGREERAGAQA
jgi:hypothetical protein